MLQNGSSLYSFTPTMSSSNSNSGPQPFNFLTNPYKAQRTWPPDFARMDPKNQFRLERKYRRRSKLAYARPRWTKGVKLAQYTSVMGQFLVIWE
jgi:hypothetical protein